MATSNIVGINIDGIPTMTEEIDEYIKLIKANKIINGEAVKKISTAIRGPQVQNDVLKLVQSADAYVETLINQLNNFKVRLAQTAIAYKRQDANASSIESATATIKNLKS